MGTQRAGAAVQLHLRLKVGLAEIDHAAAVDVRRHALAIIVVFGRGENQPHPETLGDLDRLQRSLAVGEAPRNSR